jgi:phenylalanyl-tRNA synthetase beta chain
MLLSKQWLNDFVNTSKKTDQELSDLISLSTVEVEEFVDQAKAMDGMVVGKVEKLSAHPNADKLTLCDVNIGERITQIVCGGENLREGMIVPVALPGAKVRWHGEGDLVELAKTKIRGEESEGMICASSEIGLALAEGEGERDIRDLGEMDVQIGTPLAQALGMDDIVLEVEHKSLTNRPDLFGHYGMAREIAALMRTDVKAYDPAQIAQGEGISIEVSVKEEGLCPRYMAVAMEGITVQPSPRWMQNRLSACGIRPINNIVDITNYVLLETGEPMHAFDAEFLGGDAVSIGVRTAKKGEKIVALDEETYELTKDMLVITDAKKPVAIAGVMGGEQSGVSEKTTRIVFEAANFDPVSIRKTSQALALRSESSARFEKSLDPALCEMALRRAVELVQELCPGAKVCSPVIDTQSTQKDAAVVAFTGTRLNAHLGSAIAHGEIVDILTRLGFGVVRTEDSYQVTIPSWRATKDIEIAEDIFEEVARVYGYDNVASVLPSFTITPPVQDPVRALARKARTMLSQQAGAHEVYQYAFIGEKTLETLGYALEDHIKLLNPLASDRPYLVRSLVPNLLEAVERNQRREDIVHVFQVERVFLKEEKGLEMGEGKDVLPQQPCMFAGVYAKKGEDNPFWQSKLDVLGYLQGLGYDVQLHEAKKPAAWQHAVRQADVFVGEEIVGTVAEVDPERAQALGLDHRAAAFEINLSLLAEFATPQMQYEPVATHPSVERDLAFVVAEEVSCMKIQEVMKQTSALLMHLEVFDIYCGKGVEEGKKSVALHLSFCAGDRTLDSKEVDVEIEKITQVLEGELSATIRA